MTHRKDFHARLMRCMSRGDLTRPDLACWFDRHYSTIRDWLVHTREPDGPAGREAYRLLALLEAAIENSEKFPIPPQLSGRYRSKYVQELVRRHVKRDPSLPSPRTTV